MKAFVIVAISFSILSCVISIFKGISEDEAGIFLGGVLFTVVYILALVFCCVGWI